MKPIKEVKLWNKGYVKQYDFSEANKNMENRIEAVCEIAKVCRNLETIKNPERLYNQLLTEHAGNPSEIFSFIPYIDYNSPEFMWIKNVSDYYRFGYSKKDLFYTNMRNVINFNDDLYFTEKVEGFHVFKIKVPYAIVDHLRRHQLLNFTLAENWRTNRIIHKLEYYHPEFGKKQDEHFTKFVKYCLGHYNKEIPEEEYQELIRQSDYEDLIDYQEKYKFRKELIAKGEFGLRYTEGFIGGWEQDTCAWGNFFSVRAGNAKGVQKETKELANVIYEIIKGEQHD